MVPNIGLVEKRFEEDIAKEDILDEKFGYLFVKDYRQNDLASLGVVKNQDTGGLGIVTGVLSIKFEDFDQRDEVLTRVPASVEKEYRHLSLIMVRFNDYQELENSYQKLKSNAQVKRVKVEILEYEKKGK